ncbi:MAG: 30S ribosomal protein S18 [Acidobacteria bacterium]|nr:30S ribosomal protein S18 [Acidobacteriota bacterium]
MEPQSRPHPGGRREGGGPGGPRRQSRRRKVCRFCVERIDYIDFKDMRLLTHFVLERGKITPSRISGVCAFHQKQLKRAIQRARNIALLPFSADLYSAQALLNKIGSLTWNLFFEKIFRISANAATSSGSATAMAGTICCPASWPSR